MAVFVIGDHHFGHEKILLPEYDNRGIDFPDIETHDDELIQQWNWKVSPDDTVIHFGDLSFLDPEATIHICRILNGNIIMINGNHDHRTRKFWEQRAGIAKWFQRPQYLHEGVWLAHSVDWTTTRPVIWTGKRTVQENGHVVDLDTLIIHGHNHKGLRTYSNCVNVCANLWEYTPVNLYELLSYIDVPNKKSKIKAIEKWATQWV